MRARLALLLVAAGAGRAHAQACKANEKGNGGQAPCTPCPTNSFSKAGAAKCTRRIVTASVQLSGGIDGDAFVDEFMKGLADTTLGISANSVVHVHYQQIVNMSFTLGFNDGKNHVGEFVCGDSNVTTQMQTKQCAVNVYALAETMRMAIAPPDRSDMAGHSQHTHDHGHGGAAFTVLSGAAVEDDLRLEVRVVENADRSAQLKPLVLQESFRNVSSDGARQVSLPNSLTDGGLIDWTPVNNFTVRSVSLLTSIDTNLAASEDNAAAWQSKVNTALAALPAKYSGRVLSAASSVAAATEPPAPPTPVEYKPRTLPVEASGVSGSAVFLILLIITVVLVVFCHLHDKWGPYVLSKCSQPTKDKLPTSLVEWLDPPEGAQPDDVEAQELKRAPAPALKPVSGPPIVPMLKEQPNHDPPTRPQGPAVTSAPPPASESSALLPASSAAPPAVPPFVPAECVAAAPPVTAPSETRQPDDTPSEHKSSHHHKHHHSHKPHGDASGATPSPAPAFTAADLA